ncbi:glycogen debranching protein GlgX [Pseudomarimonas salicorniae]|uniref:Glycogen debranching protein GlgX n=1 Tax=Pseudomarimonas salicorniae TaxID=2933270 RepID=A0ABT0GFA3_9GAMM|nr:glycogen debranching protein GlgX [Lysobacter sp. CAU 1642]MCK7593221.1 glycogen debranching protein GlgX [Lysobacter sp. CAU 1642]
MRAALAHRLEPGRPGPLGTQLRDGGVNFAVASNDAEAMELCVFDAGGSRELRRLRLHGPNTGVFHGFLPEAGEGLVYGLRAHGPYRPEEGLRFNSNKLLLDPFAREIVGRFRWDDLHHGYQLGHPAGSRSFDARDNAASALKARVRSPLDEAPGLSSRPRVTAAQRVLYELHVRGFSMQLPGLPEALRGRIAALAHPLAIGHFRRLGVTTLSLLPLHYSLAEAHLARQGLPNYWGYNTLGFFCLDPRFGAPGADARQRDIEMRETVQALHEAGIEVLLDVVFNHTAESDEHGPTISFRGLDNRGWYRLPADDRSRYENLSGCGNTLDLRQASPQRLVMDALRHAMLAWGVDGFRFDLASVLGRGDHGFDPQATLFAALRQDPLLGEAILIAEPWDGAPGGYQLGRFPGAFREWNDRFRDAVRGLWLGRPVTRGEFARRFTASSDLFQHAQRSPLASVNFLTAHDGFTLADLVSHSRKHNHANGEDNRDGHDHELCANFGAEGASEDPAIIDTRRRVRRAMLATLLLAQGTPMLCAGDELGNSQGGNNNAYCQDNPTGWLDWETTQGDDVDLVAGLCALRRTHPLLRHPRWFVENPHEAGDAGVLWLSAHGRAMRIEDWHDADEHALACQIVAGDGPAQSLLILFNPDAQPRRFVLPAGRWQRLLDTATPCRSQLAGDVLSGIASKLAPTGVAPSESGYLAPAHSLTLLRGLDAAPETRP